MKKTLKEENPCWDGYEMVGMKMKDGKEVPNCVPKNESVNELNLKSVGVKEFLQQLVRNQSLIKKLGFKTMKDVLAYIQGGSMEDWYELKGDGKKLGMAINEDHSSDPNDKYVVRPCKNPNEPWAVWEGEVRVKGFSTREEAQAFADMKNKEQGLGEATPEEEKEFHMKLDKLVHSTFGKSPEEKKMEEGVSPKEMDKIKTAVQTASSFMTIGAELKKAGLKYIFATSPMPIYVVQPTPNNKVAIVNKKYASKPDFVHNDIAVGLMEGRGFVAAAKKAKDAGKTEFEFGGKTYPVTLKESLNEGQFSEIDIMAREARDFKDFVKQFYKEYKEFPQDRETIKWLKSLYDGRSRDESITEGAKFKITNTISKKDWAKTHKDYKSVIDGVPYVMKMTDKGTALVPVKIVDESVKEAMSVDPRKVYGGTGAKEGMVLIAQKGLDKVLELSKKNPSNVFLVSDDNYTNFGPYYVKNGKIAKYTVANPNYDLERNKVRTLKVPSDVVLKFKIVEGVTKSVTEGKKVFRVNPAIGKAKYSISSHDGVKKHKDGSDFFDIETFKNKVDLEKAIKNYTSKGFQMESVNESASRTAMEIGGLTGMNKDAIQKFVDTHNLDIEKVFQFVKKGKLSDRMDFMTAVAGKPGNPIQKKMLKMFSESVNEGWWDQKRNDVVRKNPGLVGTKFAEVADEEDLHMMIELKRKNADYANSIKANIRSMDYLYKKYKIASSKGIEK